MADAPATSPAKEPSLLDRVRGFRTLLASAIGAKVVPLIVLHLKQIGIELTPEQQVELGVLIMAGLMAGFRFVSHTPIGGVASKAVALTSENWIKHVDVKLLARLVIADIVRLRTKPTSEKESTNGKAD